MVKVNPIQLQKHLKGVDYPVSKKELLKHAKEQGADKDAALRNLIIVDYTWVQTELIRSFPASTKGVGSYLSTGVN